MKSPLKLVDLEEKEITIQAPWGKLAALTWGKESSPPVLLVHGRRDVCSTFRPLVALLPRSFYYVSIECPGNGKSDLFPAKARFTTADYVPVVLAAKDHFQWDRFVYIGHSMGALIGKYFNFAYPGVIRRMVELDPVSAYDAWPPENFGAWYHVFYGNYYQRDRYKIYNSPIDTAPKYTFEKALDLMINARGLTHEAAEHVLERALTSTGDGFYRFTFDRRQKDFPVQPLSSEYLKKLYTAPNTPTLCVISQAMFDLGTYFNTPFAMDETAWPHGNYKVKIVEGDHDMHINKPQCIADDISQFLLDEFKAKL